MNFRTVRARRGSLRAALTGLPLAVIIAAGFSFTAPAAAQDATPEATPGVLTGDPANLDCTTAPTAATTYTIVSEESAVRYRAQEELAGRGANEAIGETNAFIGTIYFDEAGLPMACTRFDADLRTLTSDESRRDNFLYNNTLETETYPLATFILTSVEGLGAALVEGEETTFFLIGDLTMHGVTKSVSWEVTATLEDGELTGSATTAFQMADFDITPPIVGMVVSLDERVVLEADIVATVAA